jgi:hypothetical protein
VANPTAQLLWAACRPDPDTTAVVDAVADGAVLTLAAETAVAQRVSPLLHRALELSSMPPCDEAWAATLRTDVARCRAQSRLVLPLIGPLALEPLTQSGLEPVVFKGLALVDRYPDPGLRPMCDVDLILPPDQIAPAVEVLVSQGWDRRPTPKGRPEMTDLVHPSLPGLPIDLHAAFSAPPDRTTRLTTGQLWERRRLASLQGAQAFTLPPEDELVALAAHAGKPFHGFGRLIWSVDVAVVIRSATVDWDAVRELARRVRCRTALAVALTQARRLGAVFPSDLAETRASGMRASALAAVLSPEWPLVARERAVHMLKYAMPDDWGPRFMVLRRELTLGSARNAPQRTFELPARAMRWRKRLRAEWQSSLTIEEAGDGGQQ